MMRLTITVIGLLALVAACKTSPQVPETPEGQAKAVVQALNASCADSFCEGRFDYKFKALDCEDQTCTLTFVAQPFENEKAEAVQGSVVVEEIPETGLMVDEGGVSISEVPQDALSEAMFDWESAH